MYRRKKCLKEKLEMLVNENPTYFYDILPYTYVLGVSNKWIKKFESINVNPPTWYNYSDSIDIFMTSTMNTFNYITLTIYIICSIIFENFLPLQ